VHGFWGLGGNQSDAVNVKRYPVSKLLGGGVAGSCGACFTMTVRDVQDRLRRAWAIHDVGNG